MEIPVKLRRIGNSLHILIPREVVKIAKLKEGEIMRMDVTKDGAIIIRKQ